MVLKFSFLPTVHKIENVNENVDCFCNICQNLKIIFIFTDGSSQDVFFTTGSFEVTSLLPKHVQCSSWQKFIALYNCPPNLGTFLHLFGDKS